MARNYVRENVPLSRFGVLVAQLESIVASAAHKPPDPLLCFDLLSDLIAAIDEEPKVILFPISPFSYDLLDMIVLSSLFSRFCFQHCLSECRLSMVFGFELVLKLYEK